MFPVLLLTLAALGCSLTQEQVPLPTEPPTPTPYEGFPTFAPIVTVTQKGDTSASPNANSTPSATPECNPDSTAPAVRYDIDVLLDLDKHSANTTLKTIYRNDTGSALNKVVFNIEPNRKPGIFTLTRLDGSSTTVIEKYTLTGPRLEINLKSPLNVGCEAMFVLGFTVQPGEIVPSYVGNTGYFGYSPRQFNLAEWLPEVAPYVKGENVNGEWVTPKVWPLGEYTVSRMATFTASVRIQGKDSAITDVIGPGEVSHPSADTWRFQLDAARTFTLSVSSSLRKLVDTTQNGINVEIYYFPAAQSVSTPGATPEARALSGARHALDIAKQAVERFSDVYGPFPYKRMVVVEGDFPDGMEFSGLVFVGAQWFNSFDGKNESWLTLITAHEVSHQWWYNTVGNDQAQAPFLDEGLALYSEEMFLQGQYPTLAKWWWDFRVRNFQPSGYSDSTIYDFQNLRLYINAVYLRGAMMLQEIRDTIGDDAFFKWLNTYRAAQSGKVATFRDFWMAMLTADYLKIAPIRAKYLHSPDPLLMGTAVPTDAKSTMAVATKTATLKATETLKTTEPKPNDVNSTDSCSTDAATVACCG